MKTSWVTSSAIAAIPGHVQSEAVNRGMLLPIDLGKGIFVSARHPPQQKGVRKIGRLSHLVYYGRPVLLLVTYSGTTGEKVPDSYSGYSEYTHGRVTKSEPDGTPNPRFLTNTPRSNNVGAAKSAD